jgi:carboxyl-terminal processing protease
LKKLRPPFKTRNGRTVYGGGGITPDVYIPWKLEVSESTRKVMSHSKRFLFNWSTAFVKNNDSISKDYIDFQSNWKLSSSSFTNFLSYVTKEDTNIDIEELKEDKEYLENILKSEIAGVKWGRDELWGVRVKVDSQVLGALKHFNEANAFLVKTN